MANRHLSRSVVLQSLFEWDFKSNPDKEVGDMLERNIQEYAPGLDDKPFMEGLLENIVRKKEVVDEIIRKAAPEWPLEKINIVDRNILRMGLCELLFGEEGQVPPKVVINEAIELAKTFGGESSSKFVNGVLGAVYREMGEPGKDQTSKNKTIDVDPATLPKAAKAGAVVYAFNESSILHIALVHDVFGYWTLSRGTIEEGQTEQDVAVKEINTKMGLTILPEEKVGSIDYVASHPTEGKKVKQVVYFLGKTTFAPIVLHSEGGLDDARWFTLEQIPKLKMYDNISDIITKAITLLTQKYNAD